MIVLRWNSHRSCRDNGEKKQIDLLHLYQVFLNFYCYLFPNLFTLPTILVIHSFQHKMVKEKGERGRRERGRNMLCACTNLIILFRINPFLANVPILYPLKIPENQRHSGLFRGCKMGTLAKNGSCNIM